MSTSHRPRGMAAWLVEAASVGTRRMHRKGLQAGALLRPDSVAIRANHLSQPLLVNRLKWSETKATHSFEDPTRGDQLSLWGRSLSLPGNFPSLDNPRPSAGHHG